MKPGGNMCECPSGSITYSYVPHFLPPPHSCKEEYDEDAAARGFHPTPSPYTYIMKTLFCFAECEGSLNTV